MATISLKINIVKSNNIKTMQVCVVGGGGGAANQSGYVHDPVMLTSSNNLLGAISIV